MGINLSNDINFGRFYFGLFGVDSGSPTVDYDLKALFTAADQTFTDAQVLDTEAEGVESGSETVVDISTGVVEIDTNKLSINGSGTWDQTGLRNTTGSTRSLGKSILGKMTHNTAAASQFGLNTAAGIARATGISFEFTASDVLTVSKDDDGSVFVTVGAVVDGVEYSLIGFMGGFNVSGDPYYTGQTKADYTYGIHWFIEGGTFTTYTHVWSAPTDNTATLYRYSQVLEASPVLSDDFLIPTLELDPDVMIQPNFFDTFTGTNGDILTTNHTPEVVDGATGTGNPWESGADTWTIQSNAANNDPGLEASIWNADASVFTSGTYSWVAQGSNIITNDANSLKIEYVDSGFGAEIMLTSAADLDSDLVVGKIYQFGVDAKVNAGSSVLLRGLDGTVVLQSAPITNTSFETKLITFSAKSTTLASMKQNLMSAGEIIWLDNLSLNEITLDEMFATDDISLKQGVFDVNLTLPIQDGGVAGLVLALDDETNPSNFLQVYINNAAITNIEVWKCVEGVYTNLILVGVTYSAGAQLRCILDYDSTGDSLKLKVYYNGSLIGTEQTITDTGIAGNTRHGIMSTSSNNSLDNFTVMPRTNAAWGTEISSATEDIY